MIIESPNYVRKCIMIMNKKVFLMGNGCELVAREPGDGNDEIRNERSNGMLR